jgi:exosortase family protein XrtF
MTSAQNSYKGVIAFLVKFIGIYLFGNVCYGLFIEYYSPAPDPITTWVSHHVAGLLNRMGENITLIGDNRSPYLSFMQDSRSVIRVFEGCNGINVMIVYISFLIAFKGSLKQTILYLLIGLITIYLINLGRVGLLFEVARHYPAQLYFFHKYFFTALLYIVVFALWYFWVKQIKTGES